MFIVNYFFLVNFITIASKCMGFKKYPHNVNYNPKANLNNIHFSERSKSIDDNKRSAVVDLYNERSYRPPISKKVQSNKRDYENMNRIVDRIVKLCETNGKVNSITELNHAIVTAGRLKRVKDAINIFRSLNKLGFTPDLMSYNNAIWSAGNSGQLELSKSIFNELLSNQKLRPNVYTYGSLLHSCAQSKDYRLAVQYLNQMIEEGIKPNQVVFTSAMEACANSGNHKEALLIMDQMKQNGIRPDLTMINAAIKACCLGGAMDEAEALASTLRDYGSMDLFTYHTLMMGNTKLGRHQRVLTLYEEALGSSAQLDGGIYSLAMLASLNCGLFHQVPLIAEKARYEGVALTEASYTILIQSLGAAGASDQAVSCLDTMLSEGLKPNVISFAAAMDACKEKPFIVQELLKRMKANEVEPNTVVLTTAINAFAHAGGEYTDVAYKMLCEMETVGPEPNIYTYNTVTRAFAEDGRLEEAINILSSIQKRGLSPDRFTFTTLLMACGRTNNSKDVPRIMSLMKVSGVPLDEISYGAAIDAHRRSGSALLAVECLNEMQSKGLEPSAAHYNLVLRTLKANKFADKMYRMLISLASKENARINGNSYELTIEALLDEDMWKEALLIIKLMNQSIYQPSLETCVRVVEVLEKTRQYKAVFAMYRLMDKYGYDFYENEVLNGIFKNIINVAAKGVNAETSIPIPLVN